MSMASTSTQRGHGLAGADLGEVQGGLEELRAVLVEHLLVLGGLYDGLQLLDGGLVVLLLLLAPERRVNRRTRPATIQMTGMRI